MNHIDVLYSVVLFVNENESLGYLLIQLAWYSLSMAKFCFNEWKHLKITCSLLIDCNK